MTSYLRRWSLLVSLLLLLSSASSWAHDLMASYVIARLRPESIELQIKVAADSAWPLVQQISPGAVFTAEQFESEGRPLLIRFAKTMEEVTADGKIVVPLRTDVVVADDTFLFALTYPLPPRGVIQLKEIYLKKMSPDYASHIRLFDQTGAMVSSKSLTASNLTFEITLPLGKPAASSPAAEGETPTKAVTKS